MGVASLWFYCESLSFKSDAQHGKIRVAHLKNIHSRSELTEKTIDSLYEA